MIHLFICWDILLFPFTSEKATCDDRLMVWCMGKCTDQYFALQVRKV